MPHPRDIPFRAWLLGLFLILFAISAIGPDHPRDFVLEHTFTAALLAFLVWLDRRTPISRASAVLIFLYLCLHVVGAHYTYSFVPYDEWSETLFGRSISDVFGLERNHYDRLVHFAFGLLMLLPMRELVIERFTPVRGWWSVLFSIALLAVFSKVYELIEWAFTMTMSPEDAETYNGQQGDIFDPLKDMSLALLGSIISGVWLGVRDAMRMGRGDQS